MGKFSKIFHHIESKDLRNKHEQKKAAKIKEEKKKEDTKKYIASAMEQVKYNWRSTFDSGATLREGMTTSDVATISVPPKEGDGVVSTVDAIDSTSYATQVTNILGDGVTRDGNVGSVIRNSGSGTGQNGGFDVGGQYLSFQGDGYNDTGHGLRWAGLAPIDSTEVDTLEITAIVGNDSNGGEDPDAAGEELYVMYQTPAMSQPQFLIQNPDGSIAQGKSFNSTDDVIIPLGAANNSGLNKYAVQIPDYARAEGTQFILIQVASSGTGFDNYGITNINFQRKTPVNVVVPLDNPQASSFIRGAEEGSSPKKRKKDVNDQLEASDEYTQATFGNEFPGQEVRVGGEDPFKGAEIGDDVEPSPIGRTEVAKTFSRFADSSDEKKSFGDFNNQTSTARTAPTTQSEPEPEPTTPSTSTSLEPTTDEGDSIPVKPVGKIAVQGADAVNVDAQTEPTEPKPTEPEPEIPDPDPEEIKEPPDENKTPEEVEEIENEKVNQQLDERAGVIKDKILDFIASVDPLDATVDAFMDGIAGFIRIGKGVLQLGSFVEKLYGGEWFKNQALKSEKLFNDMQIFRSYLTGKIENHKYSPGQIESLAALVTPISLNSNVKGLGPYTSAQSWGISDTRHEYVDDNIYVKDGKVYTNNEGLKSLASYNTGAIPVDGIGKGYGQMIIPKDGSQPYFHFYDYNYLNLNSPDTIDGSLVGAEVPSLIQMFGANVAGFLRSILPGRILDDVINTLKGNIDTFGKGLKDRVGLDGWPPGIHGAALTDFKIPLNKLPKETQEMIAAHPLSWTPERMANMSQEEITEQLYSVMKTEADYDDYFEYTADVTRMSTEPVNTVPYAVAMEEMDKVYEIYEKDLVKKYGEDGWEEFSSGLNRETSEFFAAERAAKEDLKTLEAEERKEHEENNRVRGFEAQGALYDKLVKPLYDSVKRTLDSGGTVSKATMDKLSRQYDKYKKQADKMEEEYFKIQSEIDDKYSDQREPIENIAYGQLNKLREPVEDSPTGRARWKIVNYDGDESSGSDYTALDGTVYTGKNTYFDEYYDGELKFINQMTALYDPVANLEKYVQGNYVREAKIKEFGEKYKTISGESWTPKKKGSGKRSTPDRSKPDPRADFAGTGADAATFTFDGTPKKKKKQNEEVLLKYARPIPERKDLFERVKSKGLFNPDDIKPEFPENPPPKLDPKTGMHPQYGKKANRYKKLDPISANSMPSTGDPEIDAVVNKQKTINKIKKMARNK